MENFILILAVHDKADHVPSIFVKAVFHKFYLVHSWILCPI